MVTKKKLNQKGREKLRRHKKNEEFKLTLEAKKKTTLTKREL